MASNGIITSTNSGSSIHVDAMLGRVFENAIGMQTLTDPRVALQISFEGLTAQLPTMDTVTVSHDVKELESTEISTGVFGSTTITMYKDRVKLALSDEMKINSSVGDPLMFQKRNAERALAYEFDKAMAAAIDLTPIAGVAFDISASSFMGCVADAYGKIAPGRITAAVTGPATFGLIMENIGDKMFTGATTEDLNRGWGIIPGYGIPIIQSYAAGVQDSDSVFFISNDIPGVCYAYGPRINTEWYDAGLGATIYQSDIYRAVKSNVIQSGAYNAGVVETQIT